MCSPLLCASISKRLPFIYVASVTAEGQKSLNKHTNSPPSGQPTTPVNYRRSTMAAATAGKAQRVGSEGTVTIITVIRGTQ